MPYKGRRGGAAGSLFTKTQRKPRKKRELGKAAGRIQYASRRGHAAKGKKTGTPLI